MNEEPRSRGTPALIILAIGLWLASSILSLVAIQGAADLVASIYAAFWATGEYYGGAYYGAVALRQLVILPASVAAVAVIIGGAEYHSRNFNTPKSWRLFSRVLGVEAGILLLAMML